MKTLAVVQSSYIPWKGYFDLIRAADEFILYDNVQFVKQTWRNRNRVKFPDPLRNVRWLTIPVVTRGRLHQLVQDTELNDPSWARRHWSLLEQTYKSAPHFQVLESTIRELYAQASEMTMLSEINALFLRRLCALMEIETPIRFSRTLPLSVSDRTGKLVELCRLTSSNVYLTGPTAESYLDREQFEREGIDLRFVSYDGYPEYEQLHPPFRHDVSVLDLLFSVGEGFRNFMKDLNVRR